MNNINIIQDNTIVKHIPDSLLEFIYNISKSNIENTQYMKGRLEVLHGYKDAIDFLTGKFVDLYIISTDNPYIRFTDSYVQEKLANNWGDGIGLTINQAQVQTSGQQLRTLFSFNTYITSFDELKYFIGIKELPSETFRSCSNLESIDLQNVERIIGNNCFTNCNKLTNIGDYSNLTRVDPEAFSYTDLTGEYDFSNINEFGNDAKEALGFQETHNLISVKMPATQETLCNFYGSGVYHITNCLGIKYIGHERVRNCTNLQELDCPSLEIITNSNAFTGCSSLKTVNFPNLTTLGDCAFYMCSSLEEIEFLNLTTMTGSSHFQECTSLKSVNLPYITSLYYQDFRQCTSLTSVNIPNVTTIAGRSCFYYCTSLKSISIPLLDTCETWCFDSCSKLEEVHLPSLSSIPTGMFNECSKLNTVELKNNVSSFGDKCFYNCSKLTSISPSTIYMTSVGSEAFSGCSLLNCTIDLSQVTYIPGSAFYNCSNVIFSGLTNFQPTYIGSYSFKNCSVGEMDLSKVTYIGGQVFSGCVNFSIKNNDLTSIETFGGWAFEGMTLNGIIDCGEHLVKVGAEVFSRSECDVIIRSPQVPDVSSGWRNLHMSTGHYLYVLDNLVNDYIASGACISEQVKGISELPST